MAGVSGPARHAGAAAVRVTHAKTVVAEKFQAMVALGLANSRMKDYYDVWIISDVFDIDRSRLAQAISATFARRGTAIPDAVPDGLSRAFAEDAVKRQQWETFKRDLEVDPGPLGKVVGVLEAFLDASCGGRPGRGCGGRWSTMRIRRLKLANFRSVRRR